MSNEACRKKKGYGMPLLLHPIQHRANQLEEKGYEVQRKIVDGTTIIDDDYWVAWQHNEVRLFRQVDGAIEEFEFAETEKSILGELCNC
jgi:hypothetical protein